MIFSDRYSQHQYSYKYFCVWDNAIFDRRRRDTVQSGTACTSAEGYRRPCYHVGEGENRHCTVLAPGIAVLDEMTVSLPTWWLQKLWKDMIIVSCFFCFSQSTRCCSSVCGNSVFTPHRTHRTIPTLCLQYVFTIFFTSMAY